MPDIIIVIKKNTGRARALSIDDHETTAHLYKKVYELFDGKGLGYAPDQLRLIVMQQKLNNPTFGNLQSSPRSPFPWPPVGEPRGIVISPPTLNEGGEREDGRPA